MPNLTFNGAKDGLQHGLTSLPAKLFVAFQDTKHWQMKQKRTSATVRKVLTCDRFCLFQRFRRIFPVWHHATENSSTAAIWTSEYVRQKSAVTVVTLPEKSFHFLKSQLSAGFSLFFIDTFSRIYHLCSEIWNLRESATLLFCDNINRQNNNHKTGPETAARGHHHNTGIAGSYRGGARENETEAEQISRDTDSCHAATAWF